MFSQRDIEFLNYVKLVQPVSPRELEEKPPKNFTCDDSRRILQKLVSIGLLNINDNLKLVVKGSTDDTSSNQAKF